jgi:hypothetical protein
MVNSRVVIPRSIITDGYYPLPPYLGGFLGLEYLIFDADGAVLLESPVTAVATFTKTSEMLPQHR